jgi:hypothetical protein
MKLLLRNFKFIKPELWNAELDKTYDFVMEGHDTNITLARNDLHNYLRKINFVPGHKPCCSYTPSQILVVSEDTPILNVDSERGSFIIPWLFHYGLRYRQLFDEVDSTKLKDNYEKTYGFILPNEQEALELQRELLESFDQQVIQTGMVPINYEIVRQQIVRGECFVLPNISIRTYRINQYLKK